MPVSWEYSLSTPVVADPATIAPSDPDLSVLAFKDLALDENGDLALLEDAQGAKHVYLVEGADAIVQRYRVRLRLWLGEYFLDTRIGIPYIEQILVMDPDLILIRSLFRRAIVTTPGTKDVKSLELAWDRGIRKLTITAFSTILVTGQILTLTETPFILF